MAQISTLENITAKAVEQNAFHALRLKFNTAFLNEDFISAETALNQAALLPELHPDDLLELGRYYRMVGKGSKALEMADLAIAQNPSNLKIYLNKLDILTHLGDAELIEENLKQTMKIFPASDALFIRYHAFLVESSRIQEAESLALEAAVNGIRIDPIPQPEPELQPQASAIEPSEAILLSFLQLFSGRENAYARQWANDQGQSGYSLVNEPLTIPILKNHLYGSYTLGMYQLDLDSQVSWIAFDLDIDKSHQNDLIDPEFRSWADALMQEKVKEILQILHVYHIPAYPEDSGFKGYHIWIFLQQKTSASLAKAFAERIAAQVSLDSAPLHLEIFPKQGKISAGNFGNLVKMPYGIHRRTGRHSTMLDSEMSPISLKDFLIRVEKLEPSIFISALDSLGYNAFAKEPTPPQEPGKPDISSDPETDLEWLCIKQHCHALSHIDTEISTKRALTPNQKNVLRYTIGYLKNGPAIVNQLLRKCHNVDPNDYMKSAFKGNSTSCNKIRNLLGAELDMSLCNCTFDLANASYPSPLLHLQSLSSTTSVDLNEFKMKDLVDSYLKLLKNHQEVTRQLKRIESDILKAFETIGVSEFKTDYGVLSRLENDGEISLTIKISTTKD